MPIGENLEKYNISILGLADQIVRSTEVTSPAFIYTSAMQTTDFGSTQAIVKAKVYQLSENVGIGTSVQKTFNF